MNFKTENENETKSEMALHYPAINEGTVTSYVPFPSSQTERRREPQNRKRKRKQKSEMALHLPAINEGTDTSYVPSALSVTVHRSVVRWLSLTKANNLSPPAACWLLQQGKVAYKTLGN